LLVLEWAGDQLMQLLVSSDQFKSSQPGHALLCGCAFAGEMGIQSPCVKMKKSSPTVSHANVWAVFISFESQFHRLVNPPVYKSFIQLILYFFQIPE